MPPRDKRPAAPAPAPDKAKKERLAKALRQNLLRRKAADTSARKQ